MNETLRNEKLSYRVFGVYGVFGVYAMFIQTGNHTASPNLILTLARSAIAVWNPKVVFCGCPTEGIKVYLKYIYSLLFRILFYMLPSTLHCSENKY